MKNYIRDVIDRYINHDYPKEVDQDFRTSVSYTHLRAHET